MIREDYQPLLADRQCTCTTDPDGQPDTDGCVLHDLPLSGLLIGEEDQ